MKTATIWSKPEGFSVKRRYSHAEIHPLDEVTYTKRSCIITNPDGSIVFSLNPVLVPESWSQLATDILASKYFKRAGVPKSSTEVSARQVVHRLSNTIRWAGENLGYFHTTEDADVFEAELSSILIHQRAAFNSPVWFNMGLWHHYGIKNNGGNFYWDHQEKKVKVCQDAYSRPQSSACFIQSLNDDLMGIFDLVKSEAKLFKHGSGTGTNFSTVRGWQEKLSGGGYSSGLMRFLEVFDRAAHATKSGGTTRRAAKMVCLDMDHPEIVDFIGWKVKEELKARALISQGYPSDFNGEAYRTVSGQSSNNSVRLTDEFMNAVEQNKEWHTKARTTLEVVDTYKAKELMDKICSSAWVCADPGVQFDTIINQWHTCPNTAPIRASNPCSEYMFIDDTACNLASVNLMHYVDDNGKFDVEGFRHTCRIMFFAQEILVGFSSYPTESICKNSIEYRTLGLGYANLGTLLMVKGIPYDSEQGRAIAAAITAIMNATAYKTSAEIASYMGAFKGYEKNKEPMMNVMKKHRDAAYAINDTLCPEYLLVAAKEDCDDVITLGSRYGFRNAQATVLAPTGTIGLLMDCDTTGVEPEFSLVKWKKLAGGGYFKIVNKSISLALRKLGYTSDEIHDIITFILGTGSLLSTLSKNQFLGLTEKQIQEAEASVQKTKDFNDFTPHITPAFLRSSGMTKDAVEELCTAVNGSQTIEGAPHVKTEHYAVFNCANKCGKGTQFIHPMGHVKMMAAVQPFISGAISKTVNIPNEATVEDIEQIYFEAWRLGTKAIALYRDGCKSSQPLNTSSQSKEAGSNDISQKILPLKRRGLIFDYRVASQNFMMRTGEFEDGTIGEVDFLLHKPGATMHGMMHCLSKSMSLGLQHGVPLEKYVDALTFTKFEPAGFSNHPTIKSCTSMVDFALRVLAAEYLKRNDFVHVKSEELVTSGDARIEQLSSMMGDAPACTECGHITVRSAACYKCLNCGASMGCS